MMTIKSIVCVATLLFLTSCKHDDGYRVEGDMVVYEQPWNTGYGTAIIELDADSTTFEVLSKDNMSWAKDAETVFWGYIPLKFMDAESFEVLSVNFARDKDKVICGRDVIKETSPQDFKVMCFTDKGGYTFIYGVDKSAAYKCSTEPNGYVRIISDYIDTFEQLEGFYYKDSKKVWWSGVVLPNVNASIFKVLEGGYATDGNNIYYHSRIVKGADFKTFQVTSNYRAKDKKHTYFMDEKIE